MSSKPDYSKLPVEKVTINRPSVSHDEDPRLCEVDFFKNCDWSWVGKGCLCAVEDQGKCWACWAFVAAEAITALYHIKLKKKKPLSKQQLMDCLYTTTKEPINLKCCEKTRCFCSHYNKYYKFAMEEGIFSDREYPYFSKRKNCRCDNLGKKEIYMGPVEWEIKSDDLLRVEREPTEGRHAVLIVGYGVENGIDYYLIKNSWGVNWGYWGYARIERSLVTSLSFPVLDV